MRQDDFQRDQHSAQRGEPRHQKAEEQLAAQTAKAAEGKGSLCEEYADCLTALVKASVDLIKSSAAATLARVNEAKVKGGSLTNKARFALMDLTDLF